MKLAVIGAGAVGRSVVDLAGEYGHEVVAVADSSSAVVADGSDGRDAGVDSDAVVARKAERGIVGDDDPDDALAADYDALVEATPTTLGDAEPGFSHVRTALERDRHAVLANKGPVAERFGDLRALVADSAGDIRFEATVGALFPRCRPSRISSPATSPRFEACSTGRRTSSSPGWPPRGSTTTTSSRRRKISASRRPTPPSTWTVPTRRSSA